MLSFFKKAAHAAKDLEDLSPRVEESAKLDPISIDFDVELGGGKGWAENVSCVLYHHHQGYLCAGTLTGSIYVYGVGFQYLRKRIQENDTAIKSLHAIYPDRLLAVYEDNSLACFDIPRLNALCSLPASQWLSSSANDIIAVHVDEPGLRPFVYLSTTDGNMHVMDLSSNSFRYCDYNIPLSKVSLSRSILKAIQISPKDEKYMGLGYENLDTGSGFVIVYDLVKQKVYRSYPTSAITSLAWTPTGDQLYAGSLKGEVYCASIDKQSCSVLYNSPSSDDTPLSIGQLCWLPPQGVMGSGCLLVLLDSSSHDEQMRECIIGLAPLGKSGELTQVLSLPPLPSLIVRSFAVVPVSPMFGDSLSIPKPRSSSFAVGSISPSNSSDDIDLFASTPGLLLMTQGQYKRMTNLQLMIMALPNQPVSNWALEIGTLPNPRKLWLTSCGSGHVTTVNASKPTTSIHCFVGVLIGNKAVIAADISRQGHGDTSVLSPPYMKTKLELIDYVTNHRINEGEEDGEDDETMDESHDIMNDICVSHGELEDYISSAKPCDVVFVGQDDGYVACWGVSRPSDVSVAGRNNIWFPMLAMKSSHNAVAGIAYEDSAGILVVADVVGKIVVWEVYEVSSNIGYLQYQISLLKQSPKRTEENPVIDVSQSSIESSSQQSFVAHLDESLSSTIMPFKPNSIRHAATFDIPFASITTIRLVPEYLMIVIGTENGAVFTIALYDRNPVPIAVNMSSFGIRESVAGMIFSYYFKIETVEYVPAIYVSYESNVIVVFHLITHDLLAFCGSPINSGNATKSTSIHDDEDEDSGEQSDYSEKVQTRTAMAYACVLDADDNLFVPPSNIVPAELIDSCKRPTPEEREKAIIRKSVFAMFSSESSSSSVSGIEGRHLSSNIPHDSNVVIPKTLILLSGRRLLTYNISRFHAPKKSGANVITPASSNMVNSKIISTTDIISGNVVNYIEEASRAWSEPLPCLLIANAEGGVFALRLKDKSSVGYINLFDGILLHPIKFSSGIVLQNGVCYFNHRNKTIYSARASSITHILSQPLPTRGTVSSFYSVHARLSTGRDDGTSSSKRRRQSTFGLTSSITDLEKLFSKTKDQRSKEELFGRERKLSTVSDVSSDADSDSVKSVKQQVSDVTATMSEARQALEERGEKLEQLAKQSDDLKYVARDFQEKAKAQKEIMKQRNSRWGLF